jgi:hypothetical protein
MSDKSNRKSTDEKPGTRRDESSKTASGAEATRGTDGKPEGESHTHRSAYGGEGGEPKEPNDFPKSRR